MLTPREKEILKTYGQKGFVMTATSEAVNYSYSTVKRIMDEIRDKLNATNNTEAYYLAQNSGLLS